jgi:hypothetical protein
LRQAPEDKGERPFAAQVFYPQAFQVRGAFGGADFPEGDLLKFLNLPFFKGRGHNSYSFQRSAITYSFSR